jgi:hypothetical protein
VLIRGATAQNKLIFGLGLIVKGFSSAMDVRSSMTLEILGPIRAYRLPTVAV